MKNLKLGELLGILGLIPFFGSFIFHWTNTTWLNWSGTILFISYSSVILSFLSGTLWGQTLALKTHKPVNIAVVLSNIIALLAWGALLISSSHKLAIIILISGYLSMLGSELQLKAFIPTLEERYIKMRIYLSTIVISLHIGLLI